MNFKLIFITALFLIGMVSGISAQNISGYVKSKGRVGTNRAVYDANKEVDGQINKAVDNQFNKMKGKILDKDKKESDGKADSTENSEAATSEPSGNGSSKSSSDDAMTRSIMGKVGINMTRPANMQDSYEYSGNVKMDVEVWNDEGESQGIVKYTSLYSDKNVGFALEFKDEQKGHSSMIFDYDHLLMIILSDNGSDKSGMATPLGAYYSDSASNQGNTQTQQADAEKAEDYYSGFKKTGKSKNISGYNCDEYYFEDEENIVTYWMTTELPAELWAKMYTSNLFASLNTGRTNGFVMESDHKAKASKQRSYMIVKEVNPKQSSRISTIGYTIMTMNVPPPAPENSEKEGKGEKNK
jgi:hypothetical protein